MSVAKKLSNISLDDTFSISTVLSNIPTKALTELYLADNRESERNTNIKKTDLKKAIIPAITVSATKYLVENLSLAQLQEAVAPLKIDHEKKKNNPNSKKVLSKRLNETLVQMGIAEYLEQHAGLELLKSISVGLELAPTSSKTDLINQITEAVEAEGLRVYFSSFSEELLRDVAFDMKLEKDPAATTSKQVLVECILHNHEVPEQAKKEKIKVSKTKPEIRKGVAYQDVFQHYLVEELHDWCKKNGLKTSGSKPDLIRRILAFLDGDKENTLAGQRRVPKRKKSSTPKKATKKAPVKKEVEEEEEDAEEEVAPPKKEVGKKAAPPAPKEEDEDLDEEEEEEDLDLDNLPKYSIAFLKKYCDDEGLEVNGTKKADYIAAIDDYNAPDEDEDEEEH